VITRLEDGTLLRIRPIRADDKARLKVGLQRLSEETRQRRFLAAKPRFTAAELRYLTEVDGWDHFALVATPLEAPEDVVAAARFVRLPEEPGTAEFAIVVADPFQGRGLGTRLAEALGEAARARGVERFTATTLHANVPVQRLVARLARGLEQVEHGGATSTITAPLAA
jgi:RimJ/RimL family protein N-acetyltransferase